MLKTTYATWDKDSERLSVPRDPRAWTREHVGHWLDWAIREFSLAGPNSTQFLQQFQITGKEMCSLSKEEFLTRAPPFTGDILWAHLEILQKDVEKQHPHQHQHQAQFEQAYSAPDSSSANSFHNNNNRTYTQLESNKVGGDNAAYSAAGSPAPGRPMQNQQGLNGYDFPPSSAGPGSTVDSSSEYSYHASAPTPVAVSAAGQAMVAGGGRVPQYPPPYGDFSEWGAPPPPPPPLTAHSYAPTTNTPSPGVDSWHQPNASDGFLPVTSASAMHHHPAFLQVSQKEELLLGCGSASLIRSTTLSQKRLKWPPSWPPTTLNNAQLFLSSSPLSSLTQPGSQLRATKQSQWDHHPLQSARATIMPNIRSNAPTS